MRFAQTRWVVVAFLLSTGATLYYLLDWPPATFRECWNGYAQIPMEEPGTWGDVKGCRETSIAEAKKGNVRAAELAAFLYSGSGARDDRSNYAFFLRRAVELGSERSKSQLASLLIESGLNNCPEILGLIRSYRPSGKYPEAERMDGIYLADIKSECEQHLAAKAK